MTPGIQGGPPDPKQDHAARHANVPVIQAVRTSQPIRIDGRLDDAAWHQATAASAFRQIDPKEGEPASERTELRVVYDDEALYVGFRLFDSEPQRIVRRLSRRDDDPDADYVKLYLDPRLDHLTGAVFDGLSGMAGEFVRTPKRGEARGRYRQVSKLPFVEAVLAAVSATSAVVAFQTGHYLAMPFAALFALGYLYVTATVAREQLAVVASVTPLAEPVEAADAPSVPNAA